MQPQPPKPIDHERRIEFINSLLAGFLWDHATSEPSSFTHKDGFFLQSNPGARQPSGGLQRDNYSVDDLTSRRLWMELGTPPAECFLISPPGFENVWPHLVSAYEVHRSFCFSEDCDNCFEDSPTYVYWAESVDCVTGKWRCGNCAHESEPGTLTLGIGLHEAETECLCGPCAAAALLDVVAGYEFREGAPGYCSLTKQQFRNVPNFTLGMSFLNWSEKHRPNNAGIDSISVARAADAAGIFDRLREDPDMRNFETDKDLRYYMYRTMSTYLEVVDVSSDGAADAVRNLHDKGVLPCMAIIDWAFILDVFYNTDDTPGLRPEWMDNLDMSATHGGPVGWKQTIKPGVVMTEDILASLPPQSNDPDNLWGQYFDRTPVYDKVSAESVAMREMIQCMEVAVNHATETCFYYEDDHLRYLCKFLLTWLGAENAARFPRMTALLKTAMSPLEQLGSIADEVA